MDFLSFAADCGPQVHPETTAVIVKAESGFDPLVIRDNTTRQTLRFTSRSDAEATATKLNAAGHRLAIGYMQITTPWFAAYGVTPAQLLDGCTNIRYGTAILADNYRRYRPAASNDLDALNRSLSAYWSGSPVTGGAYVNTLHRIAGTQVTVPETPGVTDGVLHSDVSRSGWVYHAATRQHSALFQRAAAPIFPDKAPSLQTPLQGGIFFP